MSQAQWERPDSGMVASITALLSLRTTVFRHVLEEQRALVELSFARFQDQLIWLVIWSSYPSTPWPQDDGDSVLMRHECDIGRSQLWAFLGEDAYGWKDLFSREWGLRPEFQGGTIN